MKKNLSSMSLEIKELYFKREKRQLLNDISLELRTGETAALIGVNGSGKTTLLKCITGYIKSFTGNIFCNSKNIRDLPPKQIAQKIAFCAEAPQPFYRCNVVDIILFGRTSQSDFFGTCTDDDRKAVMEYARYFELEDLLGRDYLQLSQGEKQRVNLAMSMVSEANFLLLDEPASHLDPYFQKKLLSLIKKLATEENRGILAVLHDINQAIYFDKIFILNNSKLELVGKPKDLLKAPILNEVFGKGVFETIETPNLNVNFLNLEN
jgi:iron complex transport system ATP-binding protein